MSIICLHFPIGFWAPFLSSLCRRARAPSEWKSTRRWPARTASSHAADATRNGLLVTTTHCDREFHQFLGQQAGRTALREQLSYRIQFSQQSNRKCACLSSTDLMTSVVTAAALKGKFQMSQTVRWKWTSPSPMAGIQQNQMVNKVYLNLKPSELLINRFVNVYELETNHLSIFICHFVLTS